MYKTNFIYRRFDHHSVFSGYNRLTHYSNGSELSDNVLSRLLKIVPHKATKMLTDLSGIKWYEKDSLIGELKTVFRLFNSESEIFHFLYGDDSYHLLGYMPKRKNKKIICSFHLPPTEFEMQVKKKRKLKKIDGAIVVSNTQKKYFQNTLESENVFFVPHGVDTEFFVPGKSKEIKSQLKCLFVGVHMRDFDMLKSVIQRINKEDSNVEFDIVTKKKYHTYLRELSNTRLLSELTEEKLLETYRKASVLIMPLLDCTANNSILEALACGLPVVATDVGGVRDYLDKDCALLVKKGDSRSMADAILKLKETPSYLQKMSKAAREKALQYSWPLVAKKTEKVYSMMFNGSEK